MSFYTVKQRGMYRDPVRAGIVDDERHYLYSSCSTKYDSKEGVLVLSDIQLFEIPAL